MQCPNCKFYKVDFEVREVVVSSESVSSPDIESVFGVIIIGFIIWLIGFVVFPIAALPIALVLKFKGDEEMITLGESIAMLWTVISLVVCLCIIFNRLNAKKMRYKTKTDGYRYKCRHCGYIWYGK
jgi:hypothetical protein